MEQVCVYCHGRSRDLEFSLEHIWPRSLGGDALPTHFRSDEVCRTCNSRLGQWVDGAFLKNWFIQAEATGTGYEYLDPDKPCILPIMYMGFDDEFPVQEGEVCERYAGPAGAHIYHIHSRDDERWEAYTGGDFIKRKRGEGGRAYIALTTTVQYWAQASLISFAAQFPFAKCRSATMLGGDPLEIGVLNSGQGPLTEVEKIEVDFILGRSTSQLNKLVVDIHFADRFLAKLALGLGHTMLGPKVSNSVYADQLRTYLWTQGPDARSAFSIRGSGFWKTSDEAPTPQILRWPGAWVITLHAMKDGFGFAVCTPSGRLMSMLMSDEPSLYPHEVSHMYKDGVCYVVAPSRSLAIGPINLVEYITHKQGLRLHPGLSALQRMKTDRSKWPPFRGSSDGTSTE